MAIRNGMTPFKLSNSNSFWNFGVPRNIISQFTNASAIAYEDFMRDLQKMEYTNQFSANEAEKKRQWDERMSNTSIQRMVSDAKTAGINPIFAIGQGGASTPSGASASGSSVSTTKSGDGGASLFNLLGTIASIASGMYNAGAKNATDLAISKDRNATNLAVANTVRKSEGYNQNWNFSNFIKKNKRK